MWSDKKKATAQLEVKKKKKSFKTRYVTQN